MYNKGRITSVTSKAGTTSYIYDALDQLTKETRPDGTVYDYTYDEVGNRLTMTVTPQVEEVQPPLPTTMTMPIRLPMSMVPITCMTLMAISQVTETKPMSMTMETGSQQ